MLRFLGARKHRLVLSGSGGRGRTGLPGVGDESSMSLLFHLSSWGLGASRLRGGVGACSSSLFFRLEVFNLLRAGSRWAVGWGGGE